jgi:tetratricopeptide (TPR) repeat protein
MREALIAAIASLLLLPQAAALPELERAAQATRALAASQISFDGLDLGDSPKKKKKKATPKSKPKTKTEAAPATAPEPAQPPSSSPAAPPASSTVSVPPSQPAAPSTPPPSQAGTSSSSAGLGLDLTQDNGKKAAPKKGKAAPVMSFEAVDISGKSAERQRLDAATKLFTEERYEAAALAFSDILKDPKMAEMHDETQYVLSKTLYRMGLYHSSLNQFKLLLAKGPTNKFFKTCLEWLFFIAHKTVNEQIVLEEVAKWAKEEFPESFRSEFRYLLARYHFARGKALEEAGQPEEAKKSFEEAKRLALATTRNDPFYARVKYVEGTLYFREGAFAQALEAFKEVVRSNNPRTNPGADIRLRELAFMQLARTHYGHKQNRYALYYYDKVGSGSSQWLEALFEASWAHFRNYNYERALGNLITLSSPFFRDEYFPEALILKAVIYHENCRYREARAILDEFEKTYMPVHNELEKLTTQSTATQHYWDVLNEIQKRSQGGSRDTGALLERILKLALTDKDLKAVNDSILEVEREEDSVNQTKDAFRYSALSKTLSENLKAEEVALSAKAGILAKAKLELELGQLKELLGQALRIKFETTTKEKEFLEKQLTNQGKVDEVKKYVFSTAVSDERVFWPYEGEYWRDELGTYEYTLTKGCKE